MSLYAYRARDQFGNVVTGTLEAVAPDAVAARLDTLGYIPVQIKEESRLKFEIRLPRWERVTQQEVLILTRELASLLGAGVPVRESLDALIEQTENHRLREVLTAVKGDLERGLSLSEALAARPQVFEPLYVNMVEVGEQAGALPAMLDRLAVLWEREAATRKKLKSATRYPLILIAGVLSALIVFLTFVTPRFVKLYATYNVQLPLPTRILVGTNTLFHRFWPALLILSVLAGVGFMYWIRTTRGRARWDGWKLKIPVLGPIYKKATLARFARIFSTLYKSGVPLLKSLEILSRVVGNVVISRVIQTVREGARQGRGLIEPMRISKMFPPTILHMAAVGEKAGQLDVMLLKAADYYDEEVDNSINNLASTLEPILLVTMGGFVLFLALAVLMPWWNLIRVYSGKG